MARQYIFQMQGLTKFFQMEENYCLIYGCPFTLVQRSEL